MNLIEVIQQTENKLKDVPEESKTKLYKSLDLNFMDKAKFFEVNSSSFAIGLIDLSVSQLIYNKLKEYDNTTLAERIVLTKIFQELLQKRISQNRNKTN